MPRGGRRGRAVYFATKVVLDGLIHDAARKPSSFLTEAMARFPHFSGPHVTEVLGSGMNGCRSAIRYAEG